MNNIDIEQLTTVVGGKGGAGAYALPVDPSIPLDMRIPAPYTEAPKRWQNPEYTYARGFRG